MLLSARFMHMSHNKVQEHRECNTERGKSWSMKLPRAPQVAHHTCTPETQIQHTQAWNFGEETWLWQKEAELVWSRTPPLMLSRPPGAHCALAMPGGIAFQPVFFHNIHFLRNIGKWSLLWSTTTLKHFLFLKKVTFMKAENSNCLDPKYPMTPKERHHLKGTSPYKWCRICVAGPVKSGAWVDLKSL